MAKDPDQSRSGTLFRGVALGGYRSFSGAPQFFGPLKSRLAVLVGPNNWGKSNVIRFITDILDGRRNGLDAKQAMASYDPRRDRPRGTETGSELTIGWPIIPDISSALRQTVSNAHLHSLGDQDANRVSSALEAHSPEANGAKWLLCRQASQVLTLFQPTIQQIVDSAKGDHKAPRSWHNVWQLSTQQTGGSIEKHHVPELMSKILALAALPIPPIVSIQADRVVGSSSTLVGAGGHTIVELLHRWQNPEDLEPFPNPDYLALQNFVRAVSGVPFARLRATASKNQIQFAEHASETDPNPIRSVPLENIGTGLHQVISIGAICTAAKASLVCIEEPELHLHPRLQRALIDYLLKSTSNQYIVTTHSAHFIDHPEATVFQVGFDGKSSTILQVMNDSARVHLCDELGYRASDLVQANCVIWVEGPSDRLYIRHWISAIDGSLEEGRHFTFMYYGGRLLSRVSAGSDSNDVKDFIQLRSISRHMVVVMDSDREEETDEVNETKERIREDCIGMHSWAWVTAGREMENYIQRGVWTKAVNRCTKQVPEGLKVPGAFDRAWRLEGKRKGDAIELDKMKLAEAVCEEKADLSVSDLNDRITELVAFIRRANEGVN